MRATDSPRGDARITLRTMSKPLKKPAKTKSDDDLFGTSEPKTRSSLKVAARAYVLESGEIKMSGDAKELAASGTFGGFADALPHAELSRLFRK